MNRVKKLNEMNYYQDYQCSITKLYRNTINVFPLAVFCMETMPVFQNEIETRYRNLQRSRNETYTGRKHAIGNEQPWFSLEMGCIVWFTIEYVVRLAASPSKCEFNYIEPLDF